MTGLAGGVIGAFQFLTRIPIRTETVVPHSRIVPWFPVVGAVIGAAVGVVAASSASLVGPSLGAALAVVVGLMVTGAFHEDGLADVADAFGGGWTVERRLEILKDSRHGTYGVAALTSSIMVRMVALAAAETPAGMFAASVAAHTLGRTAAVVAMATLPLAVQSGLGAGAAKAMGRAATVVAVIAGLAVTGSVVGWWVVPLAAVSLVCMAVVGRLAVSKIGGLAGDVLGAVEQVVEAAVLVVMVALLGWGSPYWA